MSTSRPPSAPPAGSDAPNPGPADAPNAAQQPDKQTTKAPSAPSEENFPGTLLAQLDAHEEGEEANDDDDEAVPYPEPTPNQPIAHPADFRPFFTLIEDSSSGEHHHPSVHYIFTDDDPDLLTNAALEIFNHEPGGAAEYVNDRFVILDLSPDGKQIVSVTSLSPEWQALKTQLSPAPSWGREDGTATERGSMLRISGREADMNAMTKEKQRKDDVEGLLKAFDEHLHNLNGVLGSDEAEIEIGDTQATQ